MPNPAVPRTYSTDEQTQYDGPLDHRQGPWVAIVGNRPNTQIITDVVDDFVHRGVGVASTIENGVGAIALAGALAAGDRALGIARRPTTPQSSTLASIQHRVAQHGALVTVPASSTALDPRAWMLTRQVLADLVDAVVLIQAERQADMVAARAAHQLGKPVYVLVHPETRPLSYPVRSLLADGIAREMHYAGDTGLGTTEPATAHQFVHVALWLDDGEVRWSTATQTEEARTAEIMKLAAEEWRGEPEDFPDIATEEEAADRWDEVLDNLLLVTDFIPVLKQ
jgi:predicted Rossmann fold nucleotide-binding protein DprA/Smf involved in DNA uptake